MPDLDDDELKATRKLNGADRKKEDINQDKYGEIVNGINTYKEIAHLLKLGRSIIIGWTDEKFTHLDLLFSLSPYKYPSNYLQRGLRGTNELYVSIIGLGAFGFDIDSEKHSGYIGEKLNIQGQPVVDKLAELINGIIKEL